jgi:regulator of RNase E activity RraB
MTEEPDLRFDIDALFDHMVTNLEHDVTQEMDWSFSLQSNDIEALEKVAVEFEDEFDVQVHEEVEVIDGDGNASPGEPLLTIVRCGALSPEEVKEIAERVAAAAAERGFTYEGVECYEPIDEDELFGWLSPEEAVWRLRHMTDSGLEENAELPWTFFLVTPSLESTDRIIEELKSIGIDDYDRYDDADEDGAFGLCVFARGRNNEAELETASEQATEITERHGGRLEGIQFYTREDVEEVFGVESED